MTRLFVREMYEDSLEVYGNYKLISLLLFQTSQGLSFHNETEPPFPPSENLHVKTDPYTRHEHPVPWKKWHSVHSASGSRRPCS